MRSVHEKIEEIVNAIRVRMDERETWLNSVNKNIDNFQKCDIINIDARGKVHIVVHKERMSKNNKEEGEWKRNHKTKQPFQVNDEGKVIAGNPYMITAAKGGDPKDPEQVKDTREEIEKNRNGGKAKLSDEEIKSREKRISDGETNIIQKRGITGNLKWTYKPDVEKMCDDSYGICEKKGGKLPKGDANGVNVACKGFSSKQDRDRHYLDHVCYEGAFGDITEQEFIDKANELFVKPVGGNIEGYAYEESGKMIVVRFDNSTGEYVKGIPGERMRSFMKLKVDVKSHKVNLKAAKSYFDYRREIEVDNG